MDQNVSKLITSMDQIQADATYVVQVIDMNLYTADRLNLVVTGVGPDGLLKAMGYALRETLDSHDSWPDDRDGYVPDLEDTLQKKLSDAKIALQNAQGATTEKGQLLARVAEIDVETAQRAYDRILFFRDHTWRNNYRVLTDGLVEDERVIDMCDSPTTTMREIFYAYLQEVTKVDRRDLVCTVHEVKHFV